MANFKSNAGRKRWLGLQKKSKYAVGGLTPSTNMYGNNTIPQDSSASLVYQQSNPEYQAQLADELTAVEEDTSYQENANNEINRQNQVEGYGMRAANMGLNKITDNVVERGLEQGIEMPNSGENLQGMLTTGKDAFNQTRLANKVFQGTANAKQVVKASADTGQLLGNLSNYGNTAAKTGTAVGSGLKAFAGSAGPAVVGQVVKGVGDKMMEKNDDGDASTVDKGAGVSSLGTGIGVGVGAGVLGTMAGIGAANIWNPLGWATLAATGIGAGVSYLSKRRKARKAGEAMDAADARQTADENVIKRQQRFEGLKNKQYSGFDYGGDNKGPGFYKRGGVRQYQSTGVKDVLAKPEGFQNPYAYNPSSRNDDILAQNNREVKTNQIQTDETGLPTNRYTPSDNMSMEDIQRIMDSQGSIPLPEAEVSGDFVPQDIPTGSDPYSNNSMEQKIFDNLGMEGVLEHRQNKSNIHSATAPVGAVASTVLGGGALTGSLGGTVGGQALLRNGYNLVKAPIQKYGTGFLNNANTALTGVNQSGATVSNIGRLTRGFRAGMAGTSFSQLPDKAYGIGEGVVKEMQGEGDAGSRLKIAANSASLLPGFKQLKATIGNRGPTLKDSIKITKDIEGGYYGNAIMRTGLSLIPGDQNKYLDATTSAAGFGAKQGLFKNFLNYSSNNQPNSALETPAAEMKYGGMKNLPGGKAIDIGNGATKYVGQTHEEGGIMADPQSEIENNEIEKNVTLADGSTNPYIYSEYLKTDGTKNYDSSKKSIANVAEDLATNNAPQSEFDALAIQQEKLAGRSGNKIMDTTMAKYGGLKYQDRGLKVQKYQDEGLKPTLAGLQSQTNSNVTSMLQMPSTTSSVMPSRNTSLNRNELNLSGNTGLKNYGLDYMRTLHGGGKVGGNVNYTPDNLSAGLKGSFGKNNNNTWSAGLNKPLVDPTSIMPTSNTGMNFNVGAKFKWQDGGMRSYQTGGVTQYQTQGVVMPENRQVLLENQITFVPNVGYVGPYGTSYGFNEADVVDFINNGGLDSYNPNQGDNYMPSEESMLRDRQQAFQDSLRGNRQPGSSNEAAADPNFRRGHQGDLVVPANTTPTSIDPGNQDFEAINALGAQQRAEQQAALDAQSAAAEEEIRRVQEESRLREEAEAEERAVVRRARQDAERIAANNIPLTAAQILSHRNHNGEYDDSNATSVDLRSPMLGDWTVPGGSGSGMDRFAVDPADAVKTQEEKDAVTAQIETDRAEIAEKKEIADAEEAQKEYDGLSAKEKREARRNKNRGEGREAGDGRLLKAAQFIPAAMAFMDKPDYLENPEKVGGLDRVNLENVSLDDRQAAIKSDNAAMQRFISNAGMGSAGFSARMAGWQKKEGLAAAVTAEERRMNAEINNREATMNVDVDARNKAIQGENINRSMRVDQFNTESEAATKMQRVNAMATATQGLLTQFMDKQRIDADDRRTAAIAGQTGVMNREGYGLQTDRHFKGTGITSQDQEYWDYYDKLGNTEKKKFGGMRKIPRYGYSK